MRFLLSRGMLGQRVLDPGNHQRAMDFSYSSTLASCFVPHPEWAWDLGRGYEL